MLAGVHGSRGLSATYSIGPFSADELHDTAFHAECIERVVSALAKHWKSPQPVTHLGIGHARVAPRGSMMAAAAQPPSRISAHSSAPQAALPWHWQSLMSVTAISWIQARIISIARWSTSEVASCGICPGPRMLIR